MKTIPKASEILSAALVLETLVNRRVFDKETQAAAEKTLTGLISAYWQAEQIESPMPIKTEEI